MNVLRAPSASGAKAVLQSRATELIETVRGGDSFIALKDALQYSTRTLVSEKDSTAPLDSLQHIIVANNVEAAHLLFSSPGVSTLFGEPYSPSCNHYLHLACKLGNEKLISVCIQNRPGDLQSLGRVCYPNPCYHDTDESPSIKSTIFSTPVTMATRYGHARCVSTLVTHKACQLDRRELALFGGTASHLCDEGDVDALKLMLKKGEREEKADYIKAFVWCLRRKRSECLRILIESGVIAKRDSFATLQCHPLHFLYMHSSGYSRPESPLEGLRETTKTLLANGYDTSAFFLYAAHPATYPLYSLLHEMVTSARLLGEDYALQVHKEEALPCLHLLLKDGSDPGLNEQRLGGIERYGRTSARSAYDCMQSAFYMFGRNGRVFGDAHDFPVTAESQVTTENMLPITEILRDITEAIMNITPRETIMDCNDVGGLQSGEVQLRASGNDSVDRSQCIQEEYGVKGYDTTFSSEPPPLAFYLSILAACRTSPTAAKNMAIVVKAMLLAGHDACGLSKQTKNNDEEEGIPERHDQICDEFLLNHYTYCLIRSKSPELPQTLVELPAIIWLTNLMPHHMLTNAQEKNQKYYGKVLKSCGLTDRVLQRLTSAPLRSLKAISSLVIWTQIGRNKITVDTLPLPQRLKSSLIEIIIQG